LFVFSSANEKRKAGTQDYNFTFFVGFVSTYETKYFGSDLKAGF